MPLPIRSPNWLPLLLAAALLSRPAASGQEATPATPPPVVGYRAPRPFNLPFLIRPEKWYYTPEQGMLMLCPAHAHGPKAEATDELIHLVSQNRSCATTTIWVCRASQLATLREYAHRVDRVCINPFLNNSETAPQPGDLSWPGTDHPILNHLRAIHKVAPDRQLIACINIDGEKSRFGKRHSTFEETQWQILATIGSSFQGIAWRRKTDTLPYRERLDLLTANLLRHATDLAQTKPVDWVTVTTARDQPLATDQLANQPIPHSALCAKNRLFVVLLNPQYMQPKPSGTAVGLPLPPPVQSCVVAVRPPPGTAIVSAKRIDGIPLSIASDGDRTLVPCRFAGGGTLIVFDFKSST